MLQAMTDAEKWYIPICVDTDNGFIGGGGAACIGWYDTP